MNMTAGTTWHTAVTFALDAAGEREAEDLLRVVLGKMGLAAGRVADLSRPGDRLWVASVELDLSGLVEPGNPKNHAIYVIRQTDTAWHAMSPRENLLIYEWPSPLWLTERPLRGFLHPAVRAVHIRVSSP